MTIPLLFIALIKETSYAPFSMKSPDNLIFQWELLAEPGNVLKKLFTGYGWNTAILIIIIIFLATNFIDK
jgi:hypothetical protein